MKELENAINGEELIASSPELKKVVKKDGPLKELIIDYVGEKLQPEEEEVTVEMVLNVIAEEFPESIYALAEENWIRGYHQALEDVEAGVKNIQENENKQ